MLTVNPRHPCFASLFLGFRLFSSPLHAEEASPSVPPAHTVLPYPQLFASRGTVTFTASSDSAFLQREVAGNGDWVDVCRAPCSAVIDYGARYHVDGPGLSTSRELLFSPGASRAHADTGSLGLRVGGIVTTATGGAVALVGLTISGLSSQCEGSARCDANGNRHLGQTVLGVGVAAVVAGIVMIASGRTTVEVTRAASSGQMAF